MHILLLLTALLSVASATFRQSERPALQPRKELDNFLECHGAVPRFIPILELPAIEQKMYSSLTDFCAAYSGFPSVGMLCSTPNSRPMWVPELADPNLRSTVWSSWCLIHCNCIGMKEGLRRVHVIPYVNDASIIRPTVPFLPTGPSDSFASASSVNSLAAELNSCGTSCRSNNQCNVAQGCHCVVNEFSVGLYSSGICVSTKKHRKRSFGRQLVVRGADTQSIHPRHSYQNALVCIGNLPPSNLFPASLPKHTFENLQSLCAAFPSTPTMGFLCGKDGTRILHSHELRDRRFKGAPFFSLYVWCRDRCSCPNEQSTVGTGINVSQRRGEQLARFFRDLAMTSSAHSARQRPPSLDPGLQQMTSQSENMKCMQDTCGSSMRCGQGCVCKAQRQSLTEFAIIGCFSPGYNNFFKREIDPCPCNQTYVSHACCTTDDGLVWETAEKRLGSLLNDDQSLGDS